MQMQWVVVVVAWTYDGCFDREVGFVDLKTLGDGCFLLGTDGGISSGNDLE
jgi:hypothetical protein